MTETTQIHLSANEVQGLEYVVIGVATCFQRNDEGRLDEVLVAEPIPAADLDCLAKAVRETSYHLLYATTYAEIIQDDHPQLPSDVIPSNVVPAENFVERVQAATRTYRSKPEFRHIPLHEICTSDQGVFKLRPNLEPKRIINAVTEVNDADNIKQHSHTHKAL